MATQTKTRTVKPTASASSGTDEAQKLERYGRFVEQKVLAAPDERTRTIRLFVLAATGVALDQLTKEERAG